MKSELEKLIENYIANLDPDDYQRCAMEPGLLAERIIEEELFMDVLFGFMNVCAGEDGVKLEEEWINLTIKTIKHLCECHYEHSLHLYR